jgi:hypothetical protein
MVPFCFFRQEDRRVTTGFSNKVEPLNFLAHVCPQNGGVIVKI